MPSCGANEILRLWIWVPGSIFIKHVVAGAAYFRLANWSPTKISKQRNLRLFPSAVQTSERSWEWSSTSSAATSTGSRHRYPTGQPESSRQSRAKDSRYGLTAPASSPLSRHETSSRVDSSGHPGSTQQACAKNARCGSTNSMAASSTSRYGA